MFESWKMAEISPPSQKSKKLICNIVLRRTLYDVTKEHTWKQCRGGLRVLEVGEPQDWELDSSRDSSTLILMESNT